MTDVLRIGNEDGGAEIETEWEGEECEDGEVPQLESIPAEAGEVEEEELLAQTVERADDLEETRSEITEPGSGDYAVPEANREVWKQFGCDTEAGRMLRRLYGGNAQAGGAAKVSYPRFQSPAKRWEPQRPGAGKSCPQRAVVTAPRQRGYSPRDPDDPKNWRVPLPGRKPQSAILRELECEPARPPRLIPGKDSNAEKKGLQDRFQFCGGRMMPPAAMGHVAAASAVPAPVEQPSVARRRIDENGMNAEQREMYENLFMDIKEKQQRIEEIDAMEAANPKPCKAKTERNKEALQLRNDIDRLLKDVDNLIDLT